MSAGLRREIWHTTRSASKDVGAAAGQNGDVRLHYLVRGSGESLVLLHGNGSVIQDFESSGLIDRAAGKYRVVAFDRPGYGHSDRPRSTIWTPEAQADLIHDALARIGIERATVLGHSWGCSVAVALAHKYPQLVGGLVLASGYYYPTARADVLGMAGPAMPLLGLQDVTLPEPTGGPAPAIKRSCQGTGTGVSMGRCAIRSLSSTPTSAWWAPTTRNCV